MDTIQETAQATLEERAALVLWLQEVSLDLISLLNSLLIPSHHDQDRILQTDLSSSPFPHSVIALVIEARPDLTWRDVQHVLVHSSTKNDPQDSGWKKNGAGLWVNHKYGFGLINAEAAVNLSKEWTLVKPFVLSSNCHSLSSNFHSLSLVSLARMPPHSHSILFSLSRSYLIDSGKINVGISIPDDGTIVEDEVTVTVNGTVEHVEVTFTANHKHPSDLEIVLVSPSGTESILSEMHGFGLDLSFVCGNPQENKDW